MVIIVRIVCDLPEKIQVEVVIVKTFVGVRTAVLLSLCVGTIRRLFQRLLAIIIFRGH